MFSEKVFDHFENPRNVGRIENPDGEGIMGSGECGDYLVITIEVNTEEIITDVKFQVKGCGKIEAANTLFDFVGNHTGIHITWPMLKLFGSIP